MTQLNNNQLSSIDQKYASVTEATVTNRFGAVNKIDEIESQKVLLNNVDSEIGDQDRPRIIKGEDSNPVKI